MKQTNLAHVCSTRGNLVRALARVVLDCASTGGVLGPIEGEELNRGPRRGWPTEEGA
jgi:hypothetical protein